MTNRHRRSYEAARRRADASGGYATMGEAIRFWAMVFAPLAAVTLAAWWLA